MYPGAWLWLPCPVGKEKAEGWSGLMHCVWGPKIKSMCKGRRPLPFAMTRVNYMAGQSRTDVRRM